LTSTAGTVTLQSVSVLELKLVETPQTPGGAAIPPTCAQRPTKRLITRGLDRTPLADTGNCDHDPASDSEIDSANPEAQRSEVQLEPIDAIYTLDDYLEPCGVRPVASVNEPLPFDLDVLYRVYFDQGNTPEKPPFDVDCPSADIFMQSDGKLCVEYDFFPTATPAELECLELVVKTRRFQRLALKQWGGFKLIWGGPGNNEEYADGANMLVYYDDELAFVSLRRVGVPSAMTFAALLEDYLFLRDVVSRMLRRLKGDQPMRKQKQEETISAQATDAGDTKVTVDIEQARGNSHGNV
jgi:hypothetical protein